MALSIFNPVGDDSLIQVAARVLCKAMATTPESPGQVNWSYSVNGGSMPIQGTPSSPDNFQGDPWIAER